MVNSSQFNSAGIKLTPAQVLFYPAKTGYSYPLLNSVRQLIVPGDLPNLVYII